MNATKESNSRKYLIIARVGDSSHHLSWLEPKEFRSFDLCLSYYGEQPGRYRADCDYYSEGKGDKWQKINKIVEGFGKEIDRYQAIWIPDEFITSNAFTISQMFHIFSDHELLLAQPALTADSYSSSPALIRHPEYILRYTRFAEMTAPIFSPEVLKACLTAMNPNQTECGLEFIWPKELPYPNRQTVVIDETPVKQTVPEGYKAIYLAKKESLPAAEKQIDEERGPETPPLLIRKAGRNGHSGRNRRTGKKTRLLKHKFIKKRKLNKLKKSKDMRKLNKSVRIKKPFIKPKRKYPVVKKKRLAA